MYNRFNVLPCLVPTNFTFWSGQHIIFSSSKITGNSSWCIDLHPHVEVSRKAFISLFSFCVLPRKWIWKEDSTSRWTYKVSHLIFMSSRWCRRLFVDLKTAFWIVQNVFRVLTSQSKWLYNQVSLSFSFHRKTQEKQSKKKKRSGAFYSVCRLVH